MFYLTYSQVPELKSVPRDQWRRILVNAGAAFGATRQFRHVWWLTMFLSFGLSLSAALIAFLLRYGVTGAELAFMVTALIGYTIGFSVRTHCLRPYIRQYLAGYPTDSPPPVELGNYKSNFRDRWW